MVRSEGVRSQLSDEPLFTCVASGSRALEVEMWRQGRLGGAITGFDFWLLICLVLKLCGNGLYVLVDEGFLRNLMCNMTVLLHFEYILSCFFSGEGGTIPQKGDTMSI